jgi:TPR repeat protein
MYEKGQGVPQDAKEAVRCYRLAAERGLPGAQASLGSMYLDGHGVPQDYVLAHMWFNLAAVNGDKQGIAGRKLVSLKMTPEQIADAQSLARKWKSKTSR